MKKKSMGINAALNIVKQCCNILFPLITYPYISRVLGADSLGMYSFSDSIVQYFIMAATLGVSGYAIREGARIRDDQGKLNSFCGEILAVNIVSLMISYFVMLATVFFVPKINTYRKIILILSINIITNVIGRDWINSFFEDYFYITLRYIVFQFLALVLMFAFVKNGNDCIVYTTIITIATSGAQIANVFYTCRYVPFKVKYSKETIQHIKPMLYMFCASIATILYINSDITVLGFLRSQEEVGVYYIVGKIYTLIKTLINAVIIVTVPRISYYLGKNDIDNYNMLLQKLRNALFTLVIPCVVGVFSLSRNIILIVGGENYLSGEYALRILCLAMLFSVMGCFYAQTVLIPNRNESKFLVATTVSAVINVVLNFILIPVWGINAAAITTMISEIIIVALCSFYSKGKHNKFKNLGYVPIAIGTIGIMIICFAVEKIIESVLIGTVLAIIISVIEYFIVLIIGKNGLIIELIQSATKSKIKQS